MRVIVVGATGTIGTAVVAALGTRHNVVKVRHQEGGFHVDLASSDSINQLYRVLGTFDALVCTAGWQNLRASINMRSRVSDRPVQQTHGASQSRA